VLFESAADFYRERLLGIILTGANEDGAEGLAAIRRAGGITVVQRPQDAQASFMLRAALDRSPDSLVLSLAEIAGLLRTLESVPTDPSSIEGK
jgi:two-component system, chemotaxis family, protein-glutamate methylesterase/glutaminase